MVVREARHDDVDLQRDRQLVERCQGGDHAAFDLLYLRYFERLKRFCLRRLGDRDEAEDVAQEAFARAWKALPRFSGEKRFYPWLSVIAANLCTDCLRTRSRNTPLPDREIDLASMMANATIPSDEERIFESLDSRIALNALSRISPRHREVLIQRESNEWSYQQIADFHGVRITTVEALIFRARRSLKREFLALSGTESLGVVGAISLIWQRLSTRASRVASKVPWHTAACSEGCGAAVLPVAAHAIPVGLMPLAGAVAAAATTAVLVLGGAGAPANQNPQMAHAPIAQPANALASAGSPLSPGQRPLLGRVASLPSGKSGNGESLVGRPVKQGVTGLLGLLPGGLPVIGGSSGGSSLPLPPATNRLSSLVTSVAISPWMSPPTSTSATGVALSPTTIPSVTLPPVTVPTTLPQLTSSSATSITMPTSTTSTVPGL